MATSVVFVGVGGQGVVTLARWVGEAALSAGYDVRIAEIHGVSQRGGSVEVHLRFGEVYAAVVEEGGADYVVALEALEALRAYRYLKEGGLLVVNRRVIQPPGRWFNVEEVVEAIKRSGARSCVVPCFDVALELGSPVYENAVMLGILARLLGLPQPPGLDGRNREAFQRGFNLGASCRL
ncbi:indolepyruvate oxidoreductase subunit beta [Pyrobaculum neutrophilum]|uniref:Pyruvate ferredoxin/flavodoxin oxidoreductase n=1 Tax=Pyrobaculum neutrophilum (strain DSM 2338 / JCM 9278 / NBRC 100436 / V24Sta) TaxID=444157 RepID=B1YDC7_PYRNV|nr:indolepyruvate oxidoreductase subunit beta [Pyrobaculum neutrophilum]ACB39790.1 pyruvate ferredoxin/flavodoxin oxidoreductase [Pyrobaculum neutrophilum V24Sta]